MKKKFIFFDSEFTDLGLDPRLISIGLVSHDREFYAELTDTYTQKDCCDFVVEAVLPHLQGGDFRMSFHQLILALGKWIEEFEVPVELVTDSLSWDWPWIQELFSDPGTWPENLSHRCRGMHEFVDSPFREQFTQQIWEDPNCINLRAKDLPRHHALADAIVNMHVFTVGCRPEIWEKEVADE